MKPVATDAMEGWRSTGSPCVTGAVAVLRASAQAPHRPAALAGSRKLSFARHALIFSLANLMSLACNGALTFLLPRWLPVEGYGRYRLFILYGGFAGVLHLGLPDGAAIRWAALERRISRELCSSLAFLLLVHGAILLPAVISLLLWFRQRWWFSLAWATLAYALIWNTVTLGYFALQAGKRFGALSAVTVMQPAILLAAISALHRWHTLTLSTALDSCLGAWLVAAAAVWAHLFHRYRRKTLKPRRLMRTGMHNVSTGWSVLISGFLTTLALSLDRIVVSVSFGIRDFAIYSLAASALALVNTVSVSVSRVVFPYLSDRSNAEQKQRAYGWGESCILTLWATGLAVYFPVQIILHAWLPGYAPSLPILRVLMLSTGMTAMIHVLHANYFRSHLRQSSLLLGTAAGLAAAALLLGSVRTGSLIHIGWAMFAAVALWWTVDEWLLRELSHRTAREIARALIFVCACGGAFLLCASVPGGGRGLAMYCIAAALLTAIVYGRSLRSLPRLGLRPLFSASSTDSQ